MPKRFQGDLLVLDRINGKGCRTRCLERRYVGDAKIYCRTHDLVMVLPGLFVLRGIDDKADLSMPHHIEHIGRTFL
jgi:hypothetical protein